MYVYGIAFSASLLGAILGFAFGAIAAGSIDAADTRNLLRGVAAVVGWAAGGVIGAVATAVESLREAVLHREAVAHQGQAGLARRAEPPRTPSAALPTTPPGPEGAIKAVSDQRTGP
jgi:hypothetical protein